MDLFSNKAEKLIKVSEVQISDEIRHRLATTIPPIDDALGGGLVRGSVVLFGGEPGVGKSTLLLQLLGHMSKAGVRCVYDSAEEAAEQLKMTYERVKAVGDFYIGNIGEVHELTSAVREYKADLLVIDSIQGFHVKDVDARVGSPTQLKESCNHFIKIAKDDRIALVIICQLAKDGSFRGPKDLEHNVDVVGSLTQGKDPDKYRVLVFSKNRFGPTLRAKHIPWLSNEGRYSFDPEKIIETVEHAQLQAAHVITPLNSHAKLKAGEQKVALVASNVDHLRLVAHELSHYREPTARTFMEILSDIRAKYGAFRVTEADFSLFGMDQVRFAQLLATVAQSPNFRCESQSPYSICVV